MTFRAKVAAAAAYASALVAADYALNVRAAPGVHDVHVGVYLNDGTPVQHAEVRATSWSNLEDVTAPSPQSGLVCTTGNLGVCDLNLTAGSYRLSVFGPPGSGLLPKTPNVRVKTERILSVSLND